MPWTRLSISQRLRKKTTFYIILSAILSIILAVSYRSLQAKIGMFGLTSSYLAILLSLYTALWIPLFIFMTTAGMFTG
jgi:ABC-2 type transport system permease protein